MTVHSSSRWWSWLVVATMMVAVTGAWFTAEAAAPEAGMDARKVLCLRNY